MTPSEWESVYNEYKSRVMGYIAARVQRRADAEDLCADVFEKIYRRFDAYDSEKAALGTWIFTIARNTVIDYFRKSKPSEELDDNMADDKEVDDRLLDGETLDELAAALQQLPQELQDIVVLVYYDGKPLTEVARMMRLSYGAVKLRHQKALMLLRGFLCE